MVKQGYLLKKVVLMSVTKKDQNIANVVCRDHPSYVLSFGSNAESEFRCWSRL
jgi:hypothetical protein